MGTTTKTQEIPMKVQPQAEHEWLRRLVGEWTFQGEMTMEPGKPPEKFKGSELVRSLGDLWILAEGHSESPHFGPSKMLLTLGYDTQRKRFVGTFACSEMTHLWEYHGTLDKAGKVLTLETAGPNMCAGGTIARFKDTIEIQSEKRRTLTSRIEGEDGEWNECMSIVFRRK
jgi:hypothetical protein